MLIHVIRLLGALRREKSGAVGTEYAFLIAFIAIVAAVGMVVLGGELSGFFDAIGNSLEEIGGNIPNPFVGDGGGGGTDGGTDGGG
jgi:Flp pilus assembly pilin Flp